MKRWLALLILLAPCGGCMMFDDMYDEPPAGWTQAPPNTCGMAPVITNAAQTAEPELLQR